MRELNLVLEPSNKWIIQHSVVWNLCQVLELRMFRADVTVFSVAHQ